MTMTVHPRNPADLAVLVPYQLGYHPASSLVLTAMHERRLGVVQRHDLISDPQLCRRAATQAVRMMLREGASAVMLLAFEGRSGESSPLRQAMLEEAARRGLPVYEHVIVRAGRWYAPDCHEACCPGEGLPLPDPQDVPAVAAYVHAGVSPLPSREHFVGMVLPERDEGRAARLAGCAPSADRDSLVRSWRMVLGIGLDAIPVAELDDDLLARCALSLQEIPWRDALMTALCPGALPDSAEEDPDQLAAGLAASTCPWVGPQSRNARVLSPGGEVSAAQLYSEEIQVVRARLVDLYRLVPREWAPSVLVLGAHLAWWSGDGTIASACLERALEIDPHHHLADLMHQLLSAGVRPWAKGESYPGEVA